MWVWWLRGDGTTDTDIQVGLRSNRRFFPFRSPMSSGLSFRQVLKREIRPPTPRSEATVCVVTTGNIAELTATTVVALRSCFAVVSNNWIQWRSSGGESASQLPLKDKVFSQRRLPTGDEARHSRVRGAEAVYLGESGAADLGKSLSDIQSTLNHALAKAGSKIPDIECY